MKPATTVLTTIALLLATNVPLLAQSKPSDIKPFVNEFTLAVGRVNVAAIDFAALDRWADEVAKQAAPDPAAGAAAGAAAVGAAPANRDAAARQLHAAIAAARDWSAAFTRAGGKSAWAVFTIEDFPKGSPLFFVVPVEAGADSEALKQALSAPGRSFVRQSGSNLVVAPEEAAAARFAAIRPQDRPDLAGALSADAAAGNDLLVAAATSADAKKVLESLLPGLPNGQAATALAQNLKWATLAMKLSAKPTGRILLQAADPGAAANLKQSLTTLLGGLDAQKQPGQPAGAGRVLAAFAANLAAQAQAKGDQVAIDLQGPDATALAARVADGLAASRERARRMSAASQIKQLMLACIIVANDDKQLQYPTSLQEALKAAKQDDKLLVNPRRPNDPVGYVYVRPADGLKADFQRLVIYEKHDAWPGGVMVGFADGHVEFVADEAQFKKLLDVAQQKAAK